MNNQWLWIAERIWMRLRTAGCVLLGCALVVLLIGLCACGVLGYWLVSTISQR